MKGINITYTIRKYWLVHKQTVATPIRVIYTWELNERAVTQNENFLF